MTGACRPTPPACIRKNIRDALQAISERREPWDYVDEFADEAADVVWDALLAEGHLYQFDEDGMLTTTFCLVLPSVPLVADEDAT